MRTCFVALTPYMVVLDTVILILSTSILVWSLRVRRTFKHPSSDRAVRIGYGVVSFAVLILLWNVGVWCLTRNR